MYNFDSDSWDMTLPLAPADTQNRAKFSLFGWLLDECATSSKNGPF